MTFVKNLVWLMLALILAPAVVSGIMMLVFMLSGVAIQYHDDIPDVDMSAYRAAAVATDADQIARKQARRQP
jgi:hypothetical protein